VIVGILKRVDPYIVVTVCVIVGILKRVDPYIVVTVCVILGILQRDTNCNYNIWINPL
jgi:preprotein translocase subunit Sec61beta